MLMPALATGFIIPDRDMCRNPKLDRDVEAIVHDYRKINIALPQPRFGQNAKFMVISDCATKSEEKMGMFADGFSFEYFATSLASSGLNREDAYFTALVKRCKIAGETSFDADTLKTYTPFLTRELDVLKPPIIITCGSLITKRLVPEIKKGVMEHIGRRYYNEELDAVIIVGFNPMMIFHEASRQDSLDEVFADVALMVT